MKKGARKSDVVATHRLYGLPTYGGLRGIGGSWGHELRSRRSTKTVERLTWGRRRPWSRPEVSSGRRRLPEALGPGLFGRALDAVFVGALGQALDALFGFGVGGEHLLDVA